MITVTDIFAGAGGSSTGIGQVPGVEVVIAANHWQLAVDVHAENHQRTEHACVDLHMEDPRNFPRTDILWASPECTKWSIANSKAKELSVEMGGDPTLFDSVPVELETGEEDEINRSRLLMFDVLRFVEHHRYRLVFVENVVDIATQAKYRAAWAAWQKGLRKLGYDYRVVSLNSMHAQLGGDPAPQSRDRVYIVAWPIGAPAPDLDRALSPAAWCDRCERMVSTHQAWKPGRTVGRYRAQYLYACNKCRAIVEPGWLPASTAIDWLLPAERIADRARPLSPKTMARIREGLRRYGTGQAFLTIHRGDRQRGIPDNRTASLADALPALTASGNHFGLAYPTSEPMRTLLAEGPRQSVLVPRGAFVVDRRGEYRVRDLRDPLSTITANETSKALLIPVEGRDGKRAGSVDEPMRTQTTRNETGLLMPDYGPVTREDIFQGRWERSEPKPQQPAGLLVPYYSASETAKPTDYPVGTLTTVDRYALVTLRGTNAPKPISDPLDTVTASGNHHGLVDVSEDDVMACRFRMLEPSEIAAGMSFPSDYRWQGTKRERVRLAGNAVTPPAARDLIQVGIESIEAA